MTLLQMGRERQRQRGKPAAILSAGSVQVRRESIYYEASGSAEAGPTILFVHESGGSGVTWHGQLVGLAQGARCLVPDLPGHGRSEGLGHGTVAEYREVILGFLDALAIRWPVVVAGVCLGAAVAIDLALHAPHRISGLVLSGVSDGGRASEEARRAAAVGEAPASFVDGLFRPSVSRTLKSERMKRWKLTSPLARHGDLAAVASYPMTELLCLVEQPALLLSGEEDVIATPDLARALADVLCDGRAETLPQAGCLAMVEQPAAYNAALSRFLRELPDASPMQGADHPGGYRRF